jgi:hypothetical protein
MERSYHNQDSHRKEARYHFIIRCWQRYRLVLSMDDYKKILMAVKYGQRVGRISATFTRDLRRNAKLYQVEYEDKVMYVIYNTDLQELTTALTENPKEIQRYATGTSIF